MRRPHPVMAMLANCRHSEGWSQRDVAARIGTSQSLLSAWESGRKWPTLASADALAIEFGFELTLTPRSSMAKVTRETTRSLTINSSPNYAGPMTVAILRDFVRTLDAEDVLDRTPVTHLLDGTGRLAGLRIREVTEVGDVAPIEEANDGR